MSGLVDAFLGAKAPPLPEIPGQDTAAVQAAADAQRRLRSQQQGRQSTFLGGSVGNPLRQKTLLGS